MTAASNVQYDFSLRASGHGSYGTSTVTPPRVQLQHWTCAAVLVASSTLMWPAQGSDAAYLTIGARAVAYRDTGGVIDLKYTQEPARAQRVARLAQHGVTLDSLRHEAYSIPIAWDEMSDPEVEITPPADVWDVPINMDRFAESRELRRAARRAQARG